MDNIRIADVGIGSDDEEQGPLLRTFCLDEKAVQAAESFLLARYQLFEQVYLHKTTRGVETMLRRVFDVVAEAARTGKSSQLGLDESDPFIRFFAHGGDVLANYLRLDDFAAWSLIAKLAESTHEVAEFAQRLRDRKLLKVIDVNTQFPIRPGESVQQLDERRQRTMAKIEENITEKKLEKGVFRDAEPISIYGEIGGDETKQHKKLSIKLKDSSTREITQLSPAIRTLLGKRMLVRYYCKTDSLKSQALEGTHELT